MPRLHTLESLQARWGNRRFGTWTTSNEFEKDEGVWKAWVQCDCGDRHLVIISSLNGHRRCSCKLLRKERERRSGIDPFTALEKIWPSVMKAGRKATEKYNNAMAHI